MTSYFQKEKTELIQNLVNDEDFKKGCEDLTSKILATAASVNIKNPQQFEMAFLGGFIIFFTIAVSGVPMEKAITTALNFVKSLPAASKVGKAFGRENKEMGIDKAIEYLRQVIFRSLQGEMDEIKYAITNNMHNILYAITNNTTAKKKIIAYDQKLENLNAPLPLSILKGKGDIPLHKTYDDWIFGSGDELSGGDEIDTAKLIADAMAEYSRSVNPSMEYFLEKELPERMAQQKAAQQPWWQKVLNFIPNMATSPWAPGLVSLGATLGAKGLQMVWNSPGMQKKLQKMSNEDYTFRDLFGNKGENLTHAVNTALEAIPGISEDMINYIRQKKLYDHQMAVRKQMEIYNIDKQEQEHKRNLALWINNARQIQASNEAKQKTFETKQKEFENEKEKSKLEWAQMQNEIDNQIQNAKAKINDSIFQEDENPGIRLKLDDQDRIYGTIASVIPKNPTSILSSIASIDYKKVVDELKKNYHYVSPARGKNFESALAEWRTYAFPQNQRVYINEDVPNKTKRRVQSFNWVEDLHNKNIYQNSPYQFLPLYVEKYNKMPSDEELNDFTYSLTNPNSDNENYNLDGKKLFDSIPQIQKKLIEASELTSNIFHSLPEAEQKEIAQTRHGLNEFYTKMIRGLTIRPDFLNEYFKKDEYIPWQTIAKKYKIPEEELVKKWLKIPPGDSFLVSYNHNPQTYETILEYADDLDKTKSIWRTANDYVIGADPQTVPTVRFNNGRNEYKKGGVIYDMIREIVADPLFGANKNLQIYHEPVFKTPAPVFDQLPQLPNKPMRKPLTEPLPTVPAFTLTRTNERLVDASKKYTPIPTEPKQLTEEDYKILLAKAAKDSNIPSVQSVSSGPRNQLPTRLLSVRKEEEDLMHPPGSRSTQMIINRPLAGVKHPQHYEDERNIQEIVRALLPQLLAEEKAKKRQKKK